MLRNRSVLSMFFFFSLPLPFIGAVLHFGSTFHLCSTPFAAIITGWMHFRQWTQHHCRWWWCTVHCRSFRSFCCVRLDIHTHTGLIYGFKGLILVFGLFLAYETRSIKVKQINDSRYVGMSIYNVVVLCLITAPVAMVIASQQDASFAFMALAVIFCCFLSMLLIFVPKVS